MFTTGFPAAAFGTNCYVVAPDRGEECVIVDPGIGVLDQLQATLSQHRLKPAAVLLTHGHLDHTFSVTPVCGAQGIPAVIHADDAYRLHDPLTTLGPALRHMLEESFGPTWQWQEPSDVVTFGATAHLSYAGLDLAVHHAPGHTEGSVLFELAGAPTAGIVDGAAVTVDSAADMARTIISGDVLFKGSIGRTDLPGGSMSAMMRSLRDVVLPLADDSLVLPGHGPSTTIARERAYNPYIKEAAARG